jgi:hypothetical protein
MSLKKVLYIFLILFWVLGLIEVGIDYFLNIFGITMFMGMSALLIPFGFLYLLYYGFKINRTEKNIILILILYLVYTTVGVLYTTEPVEAIIRLAKQLYWFILFIISIRILKDFSIDKQYRFIYLVGLLSFSILLFMTIFRFTSNYNISNLSSLRWFSISLFTDRNVYIEVFLYSIYLVGLYLLDLRRKYWKVNYLLFFTGIAIIFFLGILVGSRRVFIFMFIFGILLISIIKNTRRPFIYFIIIITLAMTLKGVNLNILDQFKSNNSSIGRSLSVLTSMPGPPNSRDVIYKTAIGKISNFNILEVFIGQGTTSYKSYTNDSPHNFILTAILEGGLFKIIILFSFIILIFYYVKRYSIYLKRHEIFYIVISFVSYIFPRLISNEEFYDTRILLLLVMSFFIIFNKGWIQVVSATLNDSPKNT